MKKDIKKRVKLYTPLQENASKRNYNKARLMAFELSEKHLSEKELHLYSKIQEDIKELLETWDDNTEVVLNTANLNSVIDYYTFIYNLQKKCWELFVGQSVNIRWQELLADLNSFVPPKGELNDLHRYSKYLESLIFLHKISFTHFSYDFTEKDRSAILRGLAILFFFMRNKYYDNSILPFLYWEKKVEPIREFGKAYYKLLNDRELISDNKMNEKEIKNMVALIWEIRGEALEVFKAVKNV